MKWDQSTRKEKRKQAKIESKFNAFLMNLRYPQINVIIFQIININKEKKTYKQTNSKKKRKRFASDLNNNRVSHKRTQIHAHPQTSLIAIKHKTKHKFSNKKKIKNTLNILVKIQKDILE